MIHVIFILSILFQLAACIVTIPLFLSVRRTWPWLILGLVALLMGIRRIISYHAFLTGASVPMEVGIAEIVGLVISAGFFVGMVLAAPQFREMMNALERETVNREIREKTEVLTNTGSWQWNFKDGTVSWSPQLSRIFDREVVNTTSMFTDFISRVYHKDRDAVMERISRSIEEGGTVDHVYRITRSNGEIRTIHSQGSIDMDDQGTSIRMLGISQDITDLHATRQALQESERRYQNLYENAPVSILNEDFCAIEDWFVQLRSDGIDDLEAYLNENPEMLSHAVSLIKVKDVNAYAVKLYEADCREQLLNHLSEVFTEDAMPYFQKELLALWQGTNTLRFECTQKTLKGKRLFVILEWMVPELGKTLDFSNALITITDITDRRYAEQDLQRRMNELNSLNTLFKKATEVVDLRAVCQSVATSISEVVGDVVSTIFIKQRRDVPELTIRGGVNEQMQMLTQSEFDLEGDFYRVAAESKKPVYEVNVCPSRDGQSEDDQRGKIRSVAVFPLMLEGDLLGFLSIMSFVPRDFTRQRDFLETISSEISIAIHNALLIRQISEHAADLEKKVCARTAELSEANERLKGLDELKSMFIASMSHELRTPLNSIIGFTGLLLQDLPGPLTNEQRKQLLIVQKSGRHLLSLINDIIDISKIEAGEVELEWSTCPVGELVRSAAETLRASAVEKGLTLDVSSACPELIRTDIRRFSQVLMNVISNAVKFTKEGSVAVEAVVREEFLEVSVTDTGIGIDETDQARLFKPFSRVRKSGDPQVAGTGLGLYLSERIAHMLGGQITFQSEYGKGTTFKITFPLGSERA